MRGKGHIAVSRELLEESGCSLDDGDGLLDLVCAPHGVMFSGAVELLESDYVLVYLHERRAKHLPPIRELQVVPRVNGWA